MRLKTRETTQARPRLLTSLWPPFLEIQYESYCSLKNFAMTRTARKGRHRTVPRTAVHGRWESVGLNHPGSARYQPNRTLASHSILRKRRHRVCEWGCLGMRTSSLRQGISAEQNQSIRGIPPLRLSASSIRTGKPDWRDSRPHIKDRSCDLIQPRLAGSRVSKSNDFS
jgi:hypothetical protein